MTKIDFHGILNHSLYMAIKIFGLKNFVYNYLSSAAFKESSSELHKKEDINVPVKTYNLTNNKSKLYFTL